MFVETAWVQRFRVPLPQRFVQEFGITNQYVLRGGRDLRLVAKNKNGTLYNANATTDMAVEVHVSAFHVVLQDSRCYQASADSAIRGDGATVMPGVPCSPHLNTCLTCIDERGEPSPTSVSTCQRVLWL